MNPTMPVKLKKSPLFEVLFEVRFEPTTPAAGDLLPGLLYSQMNADYPNVIPLAMANIPRQIRDQNPDLLYQASHRLRGEHHSISVGDRVVALSSTAYPGWNRFKEMVESVIRGVVSTGLTKNVERFSFRYVNVIEAPETDRQLPLLNARIELTGSAPIERGFHLRVEKDEGNFTTVIQVTPNAKATIPAVGKAVSGLLIDVDTLSVGIGSNFLTDRSSLLEEAHSVVKRTFFSLLTPSTLEKMGPEW